MKKYDWNDERKKATPAPVMPKVSATEKVTEDQTKVPELVTEENQEKQGFFKEKTGKVLIMIGRFMFFLCPALSTSNTLFNFYCKTKQLSAAPQYVLPISSQQFAGKMSYDSYVSNELNKALSNVVQKIVKTSPFEVIYKEGYSNDDSSINTNKLDSKTFKVNSSSATNTLFLSKGRINKSRWKSICGKIIIFSTS